MDERKEALHIANKVLDDYRLDPDETLCVLARQLLRVSEGAQNALNDQIKYCSNGTIHVSARQFLDSFGQKATA